MIKWEGNVHLFINLLLAEERYTVSMFCEDYKCVRTKDINKIIFTCSEEDFIIVKLMWPDIILKVYESD
jgi:hypothetical protein